MAKKTAAKVKKKAVKKPAPKKTTTRTKSVKKKAKSTAKKPSKKKTSAKKSAKAAKKKSAVSLGRPKVTGEAKLEQFFKKDYEARQVFDFLRVETVRELEAFGPDEIIEQLTAPMVQTVERIRKALAFSNRCLKNDHRFAKAFQKEVLKKR